MKNKTNVSILTSNCIDCKDLIKESDTFRMKISWSQRCFLSQSFAAVIVPACTPVSWHLIWIDFVYFVFFLLNTFIGALQAQLENIFCLNKSRHHIVTTVVWMEHIIVFILIKGRRKEGILFHISFEKIKNKKLALYWNKFV